MKFLLMFSRLFGWIKGRILSKIDKPKAISLLLVAILMGLLSSAVLLYISTASRQTFSWIGIYGGENREETVSVLQTADRGYLLAGQTTSYGVKGSDSWLVKTDSSGNKEWSKTFGGEGNNQATSVMQTSDNGYILVGCKILYDGSGWDSWLMKTGPSGNKEWSKTFGGKGSLDWMSSITQTSDGGYALVGCTDSYESDGYEDFWLVKTGPSGNKEWSRTFGGESHDQATSVMQTSDNGYMLFGQTGSYGAGELDFWLVKTDSSGNKEWSRTFGGGEYEESSSLLRTEDGGYLLFGQTLSYGAGGWDIWLVKTDSSGNKEWGKTFGGKSNDQANPTTPVIQTSDRGYLLFGSTWSYGAGGWDIWLVKTGPSGNKEWSKTFGGKEDEVLSSATKTLDGEYICTGSTNSHGADGWDAFLASPSENTNNLYLVVMGTSAGLLLVLFLIKIVLGSSKDKHGR